MITEIAEIFEQANKIDNWSINLVKIKVSKRTGINYLAEELSDFDSDGILRTVKEIVKIYSEGEKSQVYNDLQDYDSNIISDVVYKMDVSNVIINEAYDIFLNALSNSNKEGDPTKDKYDCYVLKSSIEKDGIDIPIKFIFMQNPIKVLKKKFLKIHEKYTEITGTVIGLSTYLDVIACGNKIYFFNNSGEKLFNMERAYKTICQEKVSEIKDFEIVSDIEKFMEIANSGHNPRKFISFNKENLELLKDNHVRNNIAKQFNIPLQNGKFDTTNSETSEKIIKLLCNKGKIDPFNNKPVEVVGAKEWK